MIGGGFVIENIPYVYETADGKFIPVRRVWVVSALGDENAVYIDSVVGRFVTVQDRIWWNNNVTFWSHHSWPKWSEAGSIRETCLRIKRYGYPHDPCGSKLLKIV